MKTRTAARSLLVALALATAACGGGTAVTATSPTGATNPSPLASPTTASTSPSPTTFSGARVSAFDTDTEGWLIVGDAQAGSADPTFNAEGGNPGGYINAADDVAGGTWYFGAPASWAGDVSAAYGGALEFDLFVTEITSPFSESDIILQGGGLTLTFDVPSDPGTTWTHFSVPLTESAGWIDSATGAAPTADQFRSVLASLSGLEIRGEFNTGPDTGSLDNVRLA